MTNPTTVAAKRARLVLRAQLTILDVLTKQGGYTMPMLWDSLPRTKTSTIVQAVSNLKACGMIRQVGDVYGINQDYTG